MGECRKNLGERSTLISEETSFGGGREGKSDLPPILYGGGRWRVNMGGADPDGGLIRSSLPLRGENRKMYSSNRRREKEGAQKERDVKL